MLNTSRVCQMALVFLVAACAAWPLRGQGLTGQISRSERRSSAERGHRIPEHGDGADPASEQ
jgi:hypothetical protein